MPDIKPVKGSSVGGARVTPPVADDVKPTKKPRKPKTNSAGGLDAASAAPLAPTGKTKKPKPDGATSKAEKLHVVMAPWDGPAPIVSRPGQEEPLPKRGKVKSVYDGDTITLIDRDIKVRVQNVNAPEMKPLEDFAKEAAALTTQLLTGANQEIRLNFDEVKSKDHYGRMIAQVVLPSGEDLALKLIEKGLGHLFIVEEQGNPADFAALLAAQERARAARLGIWSTERYAGKVSISSFHANGYGRDRDDPNGEYFRLVNITAEPLELGGWTVTNKAGKSFALPPMTVKPGHTIQVFSGSGENRIDPTRTHRIFLGSDEPMWDNVNDVLTIKDARGKVVTTRVHDTDPVNLQGVRNPVSQTRVAGLGQDFDAVYSGPKKIPVAGQCLVDDGDTIFIKSPEIGAFKVKITDDRDGTTISRDVRIADQHESPPGMLAIRLMGADTPETHLEVKTLSGESVFFSQGRAGEIAAERLFALLKKATAIEIVPNEERPFDTYSRMLGIVMATVGGKTINVNEWLVEEGLAEMSVFYTGKDRFDAAEHQRMRAASKAAVEGERGIYGTGEGRCEERPVEFRRRLRATGTPPPYVIDVESKTVYTGADIDKVKPYNRLFVFQPRLREAVRELGLRRGPGVPG